MTPTVLSKKDRCDWILNYFKTRCIEGESLDVLNRYFSDAYIAATKVAYIPMPFGADRCPQLGRDLAEMARQGTLTRSRSGIEGMAGMGFPKWVWSYSLPSQKCAIV